MAETIVSKQLDYVHISYQEPIVILEFRDGAELGFPEIAELTHWCEVMSNKRPYVVLSDVRVSVNVTAEGRRAAADPKGAPLHRGTALLVNSSMLKAAMNFFNG